MGGAFVLRTFKVAAKNMKRHQGKESERRDPKTTTDSGIAKMTDVGQKKTDR